MVSERNNWCQTYGALHHPSLYTLEGEACRPEQSYSTKRVILDPDKLNHKVTILQIYNSMHACMHACMHVCMHARSCVLQTFVLSSMEVFRIQCSTTSAMQIWSQTAVAQKESLRNAKPNINDLFCPSSFSVQPSSAQGINA